MTPNKPPSNILDNLRRSETHPLPVGTIAVIRQPPYTEPVTDRPVEGTAVITGQHPLDVLAAPTKGYSWYFVMFDIYSPPVIRSVHSDDVIGFQISLK